MNLKKTFKIPLIGLAVLAVLFIANQTVGQKIQLKAIKPATKQTTALSDEQQAILAVRNAKTSVVNIIGRGDAVTEGGVVQTVNGTGFIIDSNGLIVSNNHVVQDTNLKYTVVLADGKEYEAKVLGQDKYNDVALLKIEASNLPPARLGNSDTLETGQTVFAIGNSLGRYQFSVTRGVVSGLGRAINLGNELNPKPRLQNLIQTDAAINVGNSGGPLINLAGEVVGMNTLVDREGEGLGFAVPINAVMNSVNQLKAFGKVSKPYLGINFTTITKVVQLIKQLNVSEGAYVVDVMANSPAAIAGVRAGDIITEINHEKLTQNNELDNVVARYAAGNQILITLLRNGEKIELPLILGEFK